MAREPGALRASARAVLHRKSASDALRCVALLALLGLPACSDGSGSSGSARKDAASERDSSSEEDAGADAAPELLVPCVDRPGELERAPEGKLPCELVPPGLQR